MIDLVAARDSIKALMNRKADTGGFDNVADGLMQIVNWKIKHAPKGLRLSSTYKSGDTSVKLFLGDADYYSNTIAFVLHIPVRLHVMQFDHTSAPI